MTTLTGEPQPFGARLTVSWTRAYTHGIAQDVATARRDEIAADLHDQLADATTTEISSGAASRAITTRMLLGVPADLSWRSEQARADRPARRKEIAMSESTPNPPRRTALALGTVVVAWGVTASSGSASEQLQTGGGSAVVWFLYASATLAGVVGLILLARRRAAGAALLAIAALGTTLPFFWFFPMVVVGIGLTLFFVAFWRRQQGTTQPVTPAVSQAA
jgi:hypothetical protein